MSETRFNNLVRVLIGLEQDPEVQNDIDKTYSWDRDGLFKAFTKDFRNRLMELRTMLIEKQAAESKARHMPNLDMDVDFIKFMDEKGGVDFICLGLIKGWFQDQAAEPMNLVTASIDAILKKTRRLVKDSELGKGKTVNLQFCGTWNKGYGKAGGYVSTHYKKEAIEGLDKLLDVILCGESPVYAKGSTGLTKHIGDKTRPEPEEFYTRQATPHHKGVQAFQFFKNGKLKLTMKNEALAEKMRKVLRSPEAG